MQRRILLAGMTGAATLALGRSRTAVAATTSVANPAELDAAIASAQPGDTILLRPGTWTDLAISIGVLAPSGTPTQPITLAAEIPGATYLEGRSTVRLGRSHWIVDGLVLRNGYSIEGVNVIEFKADGIPADHCTLSNVRITDFSGQDTSVGYSWIYLHGSHNRIHRCHVAGKTNYLDMIFGGKVSGIPGQHLIDWNYIGDIPRGVGNGWGALTPVHGGYYLESDFNVVEHNFFHECHGEQEIISIKSTQNTVRHNTFVTTAPYRHEISLRHGNAAEVYGNYLFNTGLRVHGADVQVYNNYISGQSVSIRSGRTDVNYLAAQRLRMHHNTICQTSIDAVGIGWPAGDADKPPTDLYIANNILQGTEGTILTYHLDLPDVTYQGNLAHGVPLGVPAAPGIVIADPGLVPAAGPYGILRPGAGSPAIDGAVTLSDPPTTDIEGRPRPVGVAADIGCHEIGGTTMPSLPPLTASDVGPGWDLPARGRRPRRVR